MIAFLLAFYLLSADQADYDGKNLMFSGKFQIEHPMGVLKADKAILNPEKKGTYLTLENNVSIEAKQKKAPFTISSKKAYCELPPKPLFSLFEFQELQFFDEVEIKTLQGISGRGGSAIYKTGMLILYPAIPSAYCQLYKEKDKIEAKEIRFHFLKEELQCLQAKGEIHPKGEKSILFSAQNFLWQKREEKLYLEREVLIEQPGEFSIQSQSAILTFQNEWEPQLLLLKENVRLYAPSIQDKESFSLADQISFSIADQTLILKAHPSKRVLFWQEGLSLSAPEIWIRRDPATKKESIEGKGEVHFAFDLEEKNIIEQLLSKYL